jgi:prepilin-type N-terminal cleavage/methylation domain-containing protein/prepilin-type processing-associated H-X9-DG protein
MTEKGLTPLDFAGAQDQLRVSQTPTMSPQLNSKRRAGFTLIELLTVIAIIGILAAIIIPTVGAVRNNAKGVRCTSNLRQIGIAIRVFANDNKGMMVPYRGEPSDSSNPGSQGWLWTEYLIPYMNIRANKLPMLPGSFAENDYRGEKDFFYICPSSPVPVAHRSWGNYALHPVIMRSTGSRPPNFPISRVQRPSGVIIIADGSVDTQVGETGGSSSDNANQYFDKTYPFTFDATAALNASVSAERDNPNTDGQIGWFRYRHGNSANCLYLDGHVKRIPFGERTKEVTYAKFVFGR